MIYPISISAIENFRNNKKTNLQSGCRIGLFFNNSANVPRMPGIPIVLPSTAHCPVGVSLRAQTVVKDWKLGTK